MKFFLNKSQALIIATFLLALLAILVGGVSSIWQEDAMARRMGGEGLQAFYLAQAGAERAKMELNANVNWVGVGPVTYAGGNYTVTAAVIACPGGGYNDCRQIDSTGRIGRAFRAIQVDVTLDGPPAPPDEAQLTLGWYD